MDSDKTTVNAVAYKISAQGGGHAGHGEGGYGTEEGGGMPVMVRAEMARKMPAHILRSASISSCSDHLMT